MKTAVLTVVHGRADHLRNQLRGLARSQVIADEHVIVAIDDHSVSDTVADIGRRATVIEIPLTDGRLPIGQARNIAASSAIESGAELLIFLDVDCIPAPGLIGHYTRAAARHGDALLCGPVTYLPPPVGEYDLDGLDAVRNPHPARPDPADGEIVRSAAYELFWSLSFAVTTTTWDHIGGFWPGYSGYGGEDTDFAQLAAQRDVPLLWVGGADAFHQHHAVSDPPVEHLGDILRNANTFHERWGWWPMGGWLDRFEALALIRRDPDGQPHMVT